ncbi:anaphase-promoting complex component Cut20/Apc4 [Plectosphaerella plurivora]|uniref:Anaphase-promoting complex subunit 4 n=1 Tax=Plectosphaerella plurivora TaxID=936078 RepID=A0A9P8V510_9PEZI|nr:anaphase-promoting complex component Cut20/Apc4 [Plectosphaerella plurivora]
MSSMEKATPLHLVSETKFDHRVPAGLPKSNPTVDLSVSWDALGKNLLIYRPKDQVVSKIHQYVRPGAAAPEPLAITWKSDGRFLAVGWSDGTVRLMGLENNKTAHHIRISEDASAKITHIGWSCNGVRRSDSQPKATASWQDLVSEELDFPGKLPTLDLPRELAFLEVDESLPKISPLPSGSAGEGEDAMVFTLRSGIEFLFQPFNVEDSDSVHAMVVGTSDGRLHLSVYDSFIIGDFRYTLPSSMYRPGVLQLVHHASHPAISTHNLVLQHPADEGKGVYLVPMDLSFISSSPINLSLLASKLTTLQKLLRYIRQTQLHMSAEYKNTRELPSRFLRAISEDLEKSDHGPTDITQALFHTVVTGHAYDLVKEWLVDNLAERGHKRWDKAVTTGLEGLRSLVHENLLPALQRCSIILSRLRGLAQFYDNRDDIGFSVVQITRAMDMVACLQLVAHRILLQVMEELELFNAFSLWLRFQIDRLAASNSNNEELTEKEAMMENGKVLAYIQRFLVHSPLGLFFDEVSQEEYDADKKATEGTVNLLDALDTQLKRHETGQPHSKGLPQVKFLVDIFDDRAVGIFKDIAEAQKRSVRFGQPTRLVVQSRITTMDSVMDHVSEGGTEKLISYAAVCQADHDDQVLILRSELHVVGGISATKGSTISCVRAEGNKITDIKFLDGKILVILMTRITDEKQAIVKLPLSAPQLEYSPYEEGTLPAALSLEDILNTPEQPATVFALPEDRNFVPVQLEVHRSTDARGELPARVCLLSRDRTTLRVFSFEEHQETGDKDEEKKGAPRTPKVAKKSNGDSI